MDTTQAYLPLSHALNPSSTSSSPYNNQSGNSGTDKGSGGFSIRPPDDDGEDEGVIEQQLNEGDRDDEAGTVPSRVSNSNPTRPTNAQQQSTKKRGPGRPKGSKTQSRAKAADPPSNGGSSIQVTPDNQAYYEFQWRILNLCAEFYGAAEELVRGTSPPVVAQCYQMAGTSRVDPLAILSDAKRVVDTLMAHPIQLISNPPPSLPSLAAGPSHHYETPNSIFPFPTNGPSAAVTPAPGAAASTSASAVAAAVASIQHSHGSTQLPQFHHSHQQQMNFHHTSPPPGTAQQSQFPSATAFNHYRPPTSHSTTVAYQLGQNSAHALGAKEGHWNEDEEDRLRVLVEDNRVDGEVDWEKVVKGFDGGRTRHQILIKSTSMGFKESSSKAGTKRKRDSTVPPPTSSDIPQPPSPQQLPTFPMPVMAATGGAGYYRPRPTNSAADSASAAPSPGSGGRQQGAPSGHQFMYQPVLDG